MQNALKVLIADDDAELLSALESDVIELGYEVLTAENGVEAPDISGKCKLDIILSDLNMPKMSGTTLLLELRNAGFYHPFIVPSGLGTREEMKVKLGVDEVDVAGHVEEVVYALAAMRSFRRPR
ncbi:MAG: response regulator [Chitinophagaceae bacterium]|nr:response regulator [Oligoflexus sp.]